MSKAFRDFVYDILEKTAPFKDEVTHVVMKKDDLGDVVARVMSSILSLSATAKVEMPDFHDVACFGSLPYLRSLLKSKYITGKEAKYEVTFHYQDHKNGKPPSIRNISIKAGRMTSFYQATNPYLNNLVSGIRKPKVNDWVIGFPLGREAIDEFKEASRIHAMAPKIGGERDDIFSLGFDGKSIIASFGEKGHQTSVVLTDDAESVEPDRKMSALFSIKQFSGLLEMIGKETAVMSLASNALRIEVENGVAAYTAVLTAKKLVD